MHKIEVIYSYVAPLQVTKRIDDINYTFGDLQEARDFLKIIKDHYTLVKTIKTLGIEQIGDSYKNIPWFHSENPVAYIKYKNSLIYAFWAGKYQAPIEARVFVPAKEENKYTF